MHETILGTCLIWPDTMFPVVSVSETEALDVTGFSHALCPTIIMSDISILNVNVI